MLNIKKLKAMKQSIIKSAIIILLVLFVTQASAQEKETQQLIVPLSNPVKEGQLDVRVMSGSITISSYEGKDVIIDASSVTEEKKNEKRVDGLKRIPNRSFGLSVREEDNRVKISSQKYGSDFFDIPAGIIVLVFH